jgi:hypothetical protein
MASERSIEGRSERVQKEQRFAERVAEIRRERHREAD